MGKQISEAAYLKLHKLIARELPKIAPIMAANQKKKEEDTA